MLKGIFNFFLFDKQPQFQKSTKKKNCEALILQSPSLELDSEMAVVVDQHHALKPPARSQRCRLLSFTNLDFVAVEPSPTDVAHSLGQTDLTWSFQRRSFSTPCLTLTSKVDGVYSETRKVELIGGKGASKARALVVEVAIALASGVEPVPVSNGLGGAYFINNRNKEIVAVTKPMDEEPLAFNNPKGFTGRMLGQPGLKRSIRVGETGIRELAAYLLDHDGFAGVPPTALVKFSHVNFHVNDLLAPITSSQYKIASLQRFVEHDSDAGDLSPSGFSVSSVHRIGILDIRLLNIDRHSGNILVKKYELDKHSLGAAELIPIDHGLCLPEWLDDPYFEWLHWPQASIPFSDAEIDYVSNLNPFEDARLLRTQLPRLNESSIRVLVVCTIFLKSATAAGLCLGDIGEMITRDCHGGEETMSVLETICARAKDAVSLVTKDIEKMMVENNECSMFLFDEECDEYTPKDSDTSYHYNKALQTQISATGCKPPLAPLQPHYVKEFSPDDKKLCSLIEHNNGHYQSVDMEANENRKAGHLVKSISFAVPSRKNEIEGISFEKLDQEEWELFLEIFERLLPEVFEERKSTGITQRVGSA